MSYKLGGRTIITASSENVTAVPVAEKVTIKYSQINQTKFKIKHGRWLCVGK